MDLNELAQRHERIAIVGGPGTGKTTLAGTVSDRPVLHTDSLIGRVQWDDVPHAIISRCGKNPRFVVEGVQTARALRKGLDVDAVVVLRKTFKDLTKRQEAMGKGVATVFKEWEQSNGGRVPIYYGPA